MRLARRRSGVTLLEIQVALVVLGVGLAGICPILVMQSKLLRKFESTSLGADNPQVVRGQRLIDGAPYIPEGGAADAPVAVLQPYPDAWVRRLGLPAKFVAEADSQVFTPVLTEQTIDDGAATLSGSWTVAEAADARGGSLQTLAAGQTGTASWAFDPITPGRYRVLIAWNLSAPMAGDATFTIGDGGPTVKAGDAAPSADGAWRDLGSFDLGSSVRISLAGSPTGAVFADAVRIGARNAVTLQPALDSDTPAASGGINARVQVGARP